MRFTLTEWTKIYELLAQEEERLDKAADKQKELLFSTPEDCEEYETRKESHSRILDDYCIVKGILRKLEDEEI